MKQLSWLERLAALGIAIGLLILGFSGFRSWDSKRRAAAFIEARKNLIKKTEELRSQASLQLKHLVPGNSLTFEQLDESLKPFLFKQLTKVSILDFTANGADATTGVYFSGSSPLALASACQEFGGHTFAGFQREFLECRADIGLVIFSGVDYRVAIEFNQGSAQTIVAAYCIRLKPKPKGPSAQLRNHPKFYASRF